MRTVAFAKVSETIFPQIYELAWQVCFTAGEGGRGSFSSRLLEENVYKENTQLY